VIIIDKQKVITGSFNFTRSADSRNAENVIIINDIANPFELLGQVVYNQGFQRKCNDL
jgi:phosphatidylserine/phosphatidylglycerophosphate/cardiolipin synthase-like enzyme